MAQFRGTVEGNRGEASRCGTKGSGLEVTANGWDIGIEADLRHVNGRDEVMVYLTSGSNRTYLPKFIGSFTADDIRPKG